MSNVIPLHGAPRRRNNDPDAIFLALTVASGPLPAIRALYANVCRIRPHGARDGRFAIVDGALLHLAGWSTCQVTVNTVRACLDHDISNGAVQLRHWPCNVSAWPAVVLSDAPGVWHDATHHPEEDADVLH